jgi:hypothetical protein
MLIRIPAKKIRSSIENLPASQSLRLPELFSLGVI